MAIGAPSNSTPPTPFNISGPGKRGKTGPAGPTGPTGPAGGGSSLIANGVTLGATAVVPQIVGRNVPAAASFTFTNQLSATLSDNTNGPLVWNNNHSSIGTNSVSYVGTATPGSGAYTYTCHFAFWGGAASSNSNGIDIGFGDGTKLDVINFQTGGYSAQTWNNATSNASSNAIFTGAITPFSIWFRASYTPATTTRVFSVSPDGFTWYVVSTTATPFLTPSQFIFGANISANNSTTPITLSIDYLVQT